ncbi:hypothetical protein F0L74_09555 [Chitinophaga agrisoli]|uniref:BON domain-containing protein n=1 Tax=Chitinophaga agrisoli TaxID=2607653 RepID=A0A5B2VSK6_9BACT|nr:hypothetical protein [Chitinophaga agrisoli]KAA2242763.1 hypothetical protein F0L74_09555 [Chitinophaga agrisoli]
MQTDANKELQEKIRLSREAFEIAQNVSERLNERFKIADLGVAANAQKVLVVSGRIDSESLKTEVMNFLSTMMPGWQLNVELGVS